MAVGGAAAARQPDGVRADVGGGAGERRTPSAGEWAWLAALPCALFVVALVLVLGPPLGALLFPSDAVVFLQAVEALHPPSPEPTEQARFLLALTAPLLLAGAVVLARRRAWTLRSAAIARLVLAAQTIGLAFVVTCFVVQREYAFPLVVLTDSGHTQYFTTASLLVAAAFAAALAVGASRTDVRRRFAALAAETRSRRILGGVVAVVAIVVWLLPAVNFDDTIGNANDLIANHVPYWLDEAFAVLDGRMPLVDFAAQYGSLWPYPVAGAMASLGSSLGVFAIATATIGAAALLALYATLRRVVRGSLVALALFLPVLATGLFVIRGPLSNRYAISNLFGTFPLRYAGPLLLMWLLARHLDGAAPRRARWLFLAAGLVVLNNPEFGIPALGAAVAALLWTGAVPTRRALWRLAAEAAIGLVGAFALVSALTLATAGSLPQLELLFRFSRLFALAGWGLLPMKPAIGMSTVVYLTYVAAIGVATVRAVSGAQDRLLTGLLAFAGVFGLGIGSYYMGRSHPEVLINMFCAWALTIALLSVASVRAIAARPSGRPALAELACMFALGLLVCSLAQVPRPWAEVARLQHTGTPIYAHPPGERFVAAHTRAGEAVVVFTVLGHRTAYNLGLADVTPDAWGGYLVTVEQVVDALDRLGDEGGRKVFLSTEQLFPELIDGLAARGFHEVAREPGLREYVRS